MRDTRIPVRIGENVEPAIRVPPEVGVKPRRVYFKKSDFASEYTLGCEGCVRLRDGGDRRPHTQACVERMTAVLSRTEEGRRRI